MECNYCKGKCIKKGKYGNVQKYQCVMCKRYQRSSYSYRRYDRHTEEQIKLLNREGVGISSMGRILQMPKASGCS